MKNSGASTMDQEFTQIFVPALNDSQKNIVVASAVLPGSQAKGCCVMPTANIGSAITDRTAEGTRNNRPEARDGLQPLAGVILFAKKLQSLRVERNMLIQLDELLIAAGQKVAKPKAQPIVGIFEKLRDFSAEDCQSF